MRAPSIALLALVALGCSALVPPPPDEIPCALHDGIDPCLEIGRVCAEGFCRSLDEIPCMLRGDGTDPCAEVGRACAGGFCRPREVCNAIDDDLDGSIDEGAESDVDGDMFTWCGSGIAALADCDDNDPGVHPADPSRGIAAPEEICDGRDNQCDGMAVDLIEASGCPASMRCSRTEGGCVEPRCTYPEFRCPEGFQCDVDGVCVAGDCTRSGCAPPQVCDAVTRACVDPRPIGSACDTDAQCVDQLCLPAREALGISTGLPAGGRRLCTTSCCDDRDCPAAFVCWAPGTGARACVARAVLEAGTLGAPEASERACSDRVACEPSSCVPLEYEAYDRARTNFVCGSGGGRTDRGACEANDQCESGICLFGHEYWSWLDFANIEAGPCTGACRTTGDCARYQNGWNSSSEQSASGDGDATMACVTARFTDTTEYVQVCLESNGGPAGSRCTTDADCLDRACIGVGEGAVCRATCCSDGDCGGGDICRAFSRGDRWEMHCAPPLQIL